MFESDFNSVFTILAMCGLMASSSVNLINFMMIFMLSVCIFFIVESSLCLSMIGKMILIVFLILFGLLWWASYRRSVNERIDRYKFLFDMCIVFLMLLMMCRYMF